MAIRIGNIKSIGNAENLSIIPDDRQTLVKVVGGVIVEDYGVVNNGEVISLSAVFSASDYSALLLLWRNRTLVNVILDDGTPINNARIVIKSTTYWNSIISSYKKVAFEIWRI